MWMAIKGLIHENNRLIKVRVFYGSQTALRSIQSAKTNHSLGLLKFSGGRSLKRHSCCNGYQIMKGLEAAEGQMS
jgi:hypothetical protein